jgi:hypothetical protein
MKFIITRKFPMTISLKTKEKESGSKKYKTFKKTIEVDNDLAIKMIAVIRELFDRTSNEMENATWEETSFPLVPFPFLKKHYKPENAHLAGIWIEFWLKTPLRDVITERSKIIDILMELGAFDEITQDPVINIETGAFQGEDFILSINRRGMSKILKDIKKKLDKEEKKIQEKPKEKIKLIKDKIRFDDEKALIIFNKIES